MRPRLPIPTRALRLAGPLVALAVALLVFGTINRGSSASTPDRARSVRVPSVSPQADTDTRIAGLQAQIRAGAPAYSITYSAPVT